MRNRVAMSDTLELATASEQDMARAVTSAITGATEDAKQEWRGQIVGAGLGQRLANTIRARVYPGAISLDPAGWIYARAPEIIDAFDRGPTIVPVNGSRMLAIPTIDTPRVGRRRMTPVEVEALYDQDLTIRHSRNGNLLAFVDAQGSVAQFTRAQARLRTSGYGRGTGAAYRRRPGRTGKPIWKLMFVLVRETRVRKRISVADVASYAEGRYASRLVMGFQSLPSRTAKLKGA